MSKISLNPGVIVISIEDMTQSPATLMGLPASIEGFIRAMGIKADVQVPETVPTGCGQRTDDAGDADGTEHGEDTGLMPMLLALSRALLNREQHLTAGEIAANYPDDQEHPLFSRHLWICAASTGMTDLGYWEWVGSSIKVAMQQGNSSIEALVQCGLLKPAATASGR